MEYVGRTNLQAKRVSNPLLNTQSSVAHRWSQADPAVLLHHTHGKRKIPSSPIRVVNLRLPTHELLLPRLVGPSPPHQVPVLLRLKHGYQIYARPHLFPSEFTVTGGQVSPLPARKRRISRSSPAPSAQERDRKPESCLHTLLFDCEDLVERREETVTYLCSLIPWPVL